MSEEQHAAHTPVLCAEVVALLSSLAGGLLVDGTVGLGGHAEALLERVPRIRMVGIDKDPQAIEAARGRLARFAARVVCTHGDYRDLDRLLDELGVGSVDGLLLDLGVSSMQLADARRGFSFRQDGPLDMRMDPTKGHPASEWLAVATQVEIAEVLADYGEERYAARIARAIDTARRREPIRTTEALAKIVRTAVPAAYRHGRIDPATRSFQAIRIHINAELDALAQGLAKGFERLAPGGILAVLSFHSLEDRIVKRFLLERAAACTCPPDLPECVCGKRIEAEIMTRRPLTARADEVRENPRARSAKLRAARKVA